MKPNYIFLQIKEYNLILLIVLFLFVRLWILQTRILPTHPDELWIGTIAKEILSGSLSIPIFDYQLIAEILKKCRIP